MRVALFALGALLLMTSGCALRPTINLRIDVPRENTIQAWGYPSPDGSPGGALYYSMGIDLETAPPFIVVLPDGHRADSSSIDSLLLAKHFAPVTTDARGGRVSAIHHAEKERRYWMIFSLNKDGRATQLSLYACRHTMAALLASIDGRRSFDFPIRQSELVELFGGPVREGKDFAILGWSCDR